jgi:hypothetical protein
MPASTIQHPSTQDSASSAGHRNSCSPWKIRGGQRLGLTAGGLRKRTLSATVLGGTLSVTDDLLGSSLEFTMLVPDTEYRVSFSTQVVRLLSVETWQAVGTMTTASGCRQVTLRARDNGVFSQRGRPLTLWLTIQATIDVPELGVVVGRRRAARLAVAAELNLNPASW